MLLKDELFNKDTLTLLSQKISRVYEKFDEENFIQECLITFPALELKGRMSSVTKQLDVFLTDNYLENIMILSNALQGTKEGQFIYGSVIEYVEVYGCKNEYVANSLQKLAEFTKYLSSEFAIRTFLNEFPSETLEYVQEWVQDTDVHIRRLCSEGLRPSLPWAKNITVDYKTASKPLDFLYYDTERYVTRSVANHLNDISKIDPDFVLDTLKRWRESKKQTDSEMTYIIKHSLRTLIKKGHKETLEFLGYKTNPNIALTNFAVDDSVKIGEFLPFEFSISAHEDAKLIIDYIVLYLSKTGRYTSKTYKYRVIEMNKDESIKLSGRRSFKEISTRSFNKGTHTIKLQINGKIYAEKEFELE